MPQCKGESDLNSHSYLSLKGPAELMLTPVSPTLCFLYVSPVFPTGEQEKHILNPPNIYSSNYLSIYLSIHASIYIYIYPSVYGSDFLRPSPMPGTVKEHSVYRMNERMNLWVK